MNFLEKKIKKNITYFLKNLKYSNKQALIRKLILLIIDSIIIFLSFLICSFLTNELNFFYITLSYIPFYLGLILPVYIFTGQYKNLSRWYIEISQREAVKKGFSFMNKHELPPLP